MIFDGFDVHSNPFITTSKVCECGKQLKVVNNGWFGSALFCPKCENVYILKAVKLPKSKVTKEFLEQSRAQVKS